MTPRIAIPLPTSFDPAYNQLNFSAYTDAVRACGGEPVELPLGASQAEIQRLIETCDGILLPGSPADVDPQRYGQPPDAETAAADPLREAVDTQFLEDAYFRGKPILGICFGVQMLNVYRGGTLIQDLTVMPVNHAAGRSVAVAHTASLLSGTLLAEVADPAECAVVDELQRVPVNSSHHQAVGIAGEGLRIVARCPQDGVVEALEGTGPNFVLGVQWHPERTFATSATSRAIFARLIAEAAQWQSEHSAVAFAGASRGR